MVKKFTQPALPFLALLELLESRGLKIEDRGWALPRLKQIGYYRLCAYSQPLQIEIPNSRDYLFKKNSSFGLLLRLYAFDRKLRLLTFEAIEVVEVAVRSCISDVMSIKHGPHWFMNASHFSSPQCAEKLIERLEEEFFKEDGITLRKPSSEFIADYYSRHDEPKFPPSWMLADALSFGSWSKIYAGISERNQKAIATELGLDYKDLESWLLAITILRNICAHHGRIWNRQLPSVRMTQEMAAAWCVQNRYGMQAAVLEELLRRVRPSFRWGSRLEALFHAYPEVDFKAAGFMKNWSRKLFGGFTETTMQRV